MPTPGVWSERPFPVDRHLDVRATVERPRRDRLVRPVADRRRGRSARRLDRCCADEADLTPYEVAGAVARALPRGGLLVVGASNPIRDLDLMVPRYEVGGRRKVIANRGLSGIDGTVSTAVGAALGRDSTQALRADGRRDIPARRQRAGPRRPRPRARPDDRRRQRRRRLDLRDARAGRARARRPVRPAVRHAHGVDLASLCAATRTPHWRVESLPELEQALASPNGGIEVVEVRVRRDNRRELDARIRQLAGTRATLIKREGTRPSTMNAWPQR